jgi:hypothetical protein
MSNDPDGRMMGLIVRGDSVCRFGAGFVLAAGGGVIGAAGTLLDRDGVFATALSLVAGDLVPDVSTFGDGIAGAA